MEVENTVIFKFAIRPLSDWDLIPDLISIPVSKTILDLKNQIKNSNNVEVERQILMFEGKLLINDKKISDYGFVPSQTVQSLSFEVTPLSFLVGVKYDSEERKISVGSKTLVNDLKVEIASLWFWEISPEDMMLTLHFHDPDMQGESVEMDKGLWPIGYYNVSPRSGIELKVKPGAETDVKPPSP